MSYTPRRVPPWPAYGGSEGLVPAFLLLQGVWPVIGRMSELETSFFSFSVLCCFRRHFLGVSKSPTPQPLFEENKPLALQPRSACAPGDHAPLMFVLNTTSRGSAPLITMFSTDDTQTHAASAPLLDCASQYTALQEGSKESRGAMCLGT